MQEMTKTKIVGLDVSGIQKIVRFNIAHSDGETTVDQDLILTKRSDGTWRADLKFLGMPSQGTANDAATKLGDWMSRLSKAIAAGNFHTINLEVDI